MNPLDVLEECEAAPQGNARIEVLRKGDSPELRELLRLATDPSVTFGVKALPEPIVKKGQYTHSPWLPQLLSLAYKLANRELTGHAALDRIAEFTGQQCTAQERKWSERILKQDLRINIGAKDVNKALPGTVYLFEVPLATDYLKIKNIEKHTSTGYWILEPKLDGSRCCAMLPKHKGEVRLFSRTGKEWSNFESIKAVLQKFNDKRNGNQTLYLDGEVVAMVDGKVNFQALQGMMMRSANHEVEELVYIVFDSAVESEWKNPKLHYGARLEDTLNITTSIHLSCLNESRKVVAIDYKRIVNPTEDTLRDECLEAMKMGFEGVMVRRGDAPVENKRGKNLLKVKMFQDMEALVVGIVEGTGKHAGKMGALACKTLDGVHFEIGTGFSDADREEIWRMKELPKFVCLKFQELTRDGVPRFPVYKSFRHEDDFGS